MQTVEINGRNGILDAILEFFGGANENRRNLKPEKTIFPTKFIAGTYRISLGAFILQDGNTIKLGKNTK
jgi:hypothetical protein